MYHPDLPKQSPGSGAPEPQITILDRTGQRVSDYEQLEQIGDAYPVILIGQPPEPEILTVDVRPALEKIGLADQFRNRTKHGDVDIAVIPLQAISMPGAEYSTVVLHAKAEEPDGSLIVALLKKDILGKYHIVGHIDMRTEPRKKATAFVSRAAEVRRELRGPIPEEAQALLDWFGERRDGDVAVRVNDEFKGQKYGRLLWDISLATCELAGIPEIAVRSDITVGQNPDRPGQSFYRNLGAYPILFATANRTLDNFTLDSELRASTTLSDTQVDHLSWSLGIPPTRPEASARQSLRARVQRLAPTITAQLLQNRGRATNPNGDLFSMNLCTEATQYIPASALAQSGLTPKLTWVTAGHHNALHGILEDPATGTIVDPTCGQWTNDSTGRRLTELIRTNPTLFVGRVLVATPEEIEEKLGWKYQRGSATQ